MSNIQALQSRFGIDGCVRFEQGANGLPQIVVDSEQAEAKIYLHGAHVTHYQPTNQTPLLFMSRCSEMQHGAPIRGGVPICFPWFGQKTDDADAPKHGLARLVEWEVESVRLVSNRDIEVTLRYQPQANMQNYWPHPFELRHKVTVGSSLTMALETRNVGHGAFTYEQALHTYLAVGDVAAIQIYGLEGTAYLDKVTPPENKRQGPKPIDIAMETDRVYLETLTACMVKDPSLKRNIVIEKEGSNNTVVWNPWADKAKAMPDFGDDEYKHMVCVETCAVGANAVTLAAGGSYEMAARIGCT